MKIPFNKPFIVGKELDYIAEAVKRGHLAGNGLFTQKCQELMENRFNAKRIFLTQSGTSALEMAALLIDIKEGDEVILPSFTFVTTASAFALRGAKIRFVDIRSDTLNMNEELLESIISNKTKAIVPVHYGGNPCDMTSINRIASTKNIRVIEDAAQGVNSRFKGKYLGTWGDVGIYSFHETKNYICGEGGAIIINDENLIDKAEIILEKGTDRRSFLRGEIDKYSWMSLGSSYLPSELNAAFLYAQLEQMDKISNKRDAIIRRYCNGLTILQERGIVRIPHECESSTGNNHMFYLIIEDMARRDKYIDFMKKHGIQVVFHYVPLHSSPMGKEMGYREGDFPVTENLGSRLVRLPCYYDLDEADQDTVIRLTLDFFNG